MVTAPRHTSWAAAGQLDRVDDHRDNPEWVRALWYADDARLVKITADSQLAVCKDATRLRTSRPFVEYDPQRHFLLGLVDEAPWFAVEAVLDPPFRTLRELGDVLDPLEQEIAVTATAVTNWHRAAPRCAACGQPTHVMNGGFARLCRHCGREHFPRTDPAVIVAVVDEADRLLLARAATWDEQRVSVLAGFVEAGESFEQAVHREIAEESDLRLSQMEYFGSQPWPFPRSIMIGFFARAASSEISIDGDEIVYADWFTRDRLDRELGDGTVTLPGTASIAYRLIATWREGAHPLASR